VTLPVPESEEAPSVSVDVENFDMLSKSLADHHWEQLAELRECPVGKTSLYGGVWLLSKYDDVMAAARDWQTYSSASGSAPVPLNTGGDIKLMPISTDPPLQRELRRLIDRHFGPKKVAAAREDVRRGAVALFENFQRRGQCEFISEYAVAFPANTFFQYSFGVGPDTTGRVMGWLDHMLHAPNEAQESVQAFFGWTRELLDGRRESGPRDDVLDSLLTGTVHGRELTDPERMMIIMNLIIGGIETTTHVLGNVMHHLAARPAIRERLAADRGLIPAAVEEFLRYESPADARGREATCPVQVGEAHIEQADRVALFYSAANRDPAKYDAPDEIMLDRFAGRAAPHLSFGAGPHRCPGAHLARLEIAVTIEEALDRLRDLVLADQDITYTYGLTRGPVAVPLTFRPYSAADPVRDQAAGRD
jgi:cytochrome P450